MKRQNKFRKAHGKYRNECRRRNYKKSRPQIRKNKPWTPEEEALILGPILIVNYTDIELAKITNRSVQAIQQKRYKLKNASP